MTWNTPPRDRQAQARFRRIVLDRDPWCQCPTCPACTPTGCTQPAEVADHIINLANGGTNHSTNGQGLCHPCHNHKTQQEAQQARRPRTRPTPPHPGLR